MTVFPLCSLMENYAIRRLQEQFITQVAAQVLFEEGVKYMEQEMDEIGGMEASTSKSTIFSQTQVVLILATVYAAAMAANELGTPVCASASLSVTFSFSVINIISFF